MRLVGRSCFLFLEFCVCDRVVSIWVLPIGFLVEKGGAKRGILEPQCGQPGIYLCDSGSGVVWGRCVLLPEYTIPGRKWTNASDRTDRIGHPSWCLSVGCVSVPVMRFLDEIGSKTNYDFGHRFRIAFRFGFWFRFGFRFGS